MRMTILHSTSKRRKTTCKCYIHPARVGISIVKAGISAYLQEPYEAIESISSLIEDIYACREIERSLNELWESFLRGEISIEEFQERLEQETIKAKQHGCTCYDGFVLDIGYDRRDVVYDLIEFLGWSAVKLVKLRKERLFNKHIIGT